MGDERSSRWPEEATQVIASFPWAPSTMLAFTAQGEYPLAFPNECPVRLLFLRFSVKHRVTPSFHDYPEVSLVCEGRGRFIVEQRAYEVAAGDVLLVGGREFHRLEAGPGCALRVASIHFRPELVHAPGDSQLGFEYLRPFQHRGKGFSHRIAATDLPRGYVLDRVRGLYEEIEAKRVDYPLAVRTYLADILFVVSRHYRLSGCELAPSNQRAREFDRLLEVFSFIRKNCHERLPLERMAKMAHMSPGYFCRFFKATTGDTPTGYILRLRVDLAADLLSNSAMSVTDVAYATGFSSHSYFDRVFKRLKGMTPLEYRRHLKL